MCFQQRGVGRSIEQARKFASSVAAAGGDDDDDDDEDNDSGSDDGGGGGDGGDSDGDGEEEEDDDGGEAGERPSTRLAADGGLEVVDSEAMIAALPLQYVDLKKSMYPVTKLCVRCVPGRALRRVLYMLPWCGHTVRSAAVAVLPATSQRLCARVW